MQAAKLALTATLHAAASGAGAGAGADAAPALVELPFQAGMGFGDAPASAGQTIVVPLAQHADTYLLDISKPELVDVQPRVAGKAPGMRYGASACSCGLQVLLFGGWEGGRALAELLVLDLSAMHSSAGE